MKGQEYHNSKSKKTQLFYLHSAAVCKSRLKINVVYFSHPAKTHKNPYKTPSKFLNARLC